MFASLIRSDIALQHMIPAGIRASVLGFVLLASGCQTPFLVFPGKALQGDIEHVESFDFFNQYNVLQLEVNPDNPYSVYLGVVVIEGELYIDAAPGRRWHKLLQQNRSVRIGKNGVIYPAVAVRTDDPKIARRFLPGRTIYRVDPQPRELSHQ